MENDDVETKRPQYPLSSPVVEDLVLWMWVPLRMVDSGRECKVVGTFLVVMCGW
jgi:hypothetical protein